MCFFFPSLAAAKGITGCSQRDERWRIDELAEEEMLRGDIEHNRGGNGYQ